MMTGDDHAAPRPAVLAELPHVGDAPIAPQVVPTPPERSGSRTARSVHSTHPAFADLADLPHEVESPKQVGRRQTRYVDRAHTVHDWEEPETYEEELPEPRGRGTPSQNRVVHRHPHSRRAPRHQSSLGALLSETHAQLGSFAGLIVTVALMASAGLLMWMMSAQRHSGTEFDDFALPGFRVESNTEMTSAEQTSPLVDTGFNPGAPQVEDFEYVPPTSPAEQASPSQSSTPAPADTNAMIPRPIMEQVAEPSQPLGELSFPVTHTPLALDYSKARNSSADSLQELPAVAERGAPAITEPINR